MHSRRALTVSLIGVLSSSAALPAMAHPQTQPDQPVEPAITVDQHQLEFELRPGVWFPRLDGEVSLDPGDEISLDEDPNLGLDDSEAAFNMEAALRLNQAWQFDLSGFAFSTDGDAVFDGSAQFGSLSLDPGDVVDSSFDMTSVAAGAAYWWFKPFERGRNSSRVDMWIAPGAGVRWIGVEHSVDVLGEGVEDIDADWVSPYASLEMRMRYDVPESLPVIDELEIGGLFAVGPVFGGGSGLAWHLRATLTAYVCPNVGLSVGYRLLDVGAEDGDFELTGGLQGLFVGASVEF